MLRETLVLFILLSISLFCKAEELNKAPLVVKQIGSFYIGGELTSLSGLPSYEAVVAVNAPKRKVDPNGDFWTGQMYVQFIELVNPKSAYPLLFWHGGGLTGSCWESTPDGREGWQMFFSRQGYNVFISDAVERGRASWSRYPEIYKTEPIFRPSAHAWESFRIGKSYDVDPHVRQPYPGTQYPVESFEASMMAAVPRWSSNNAAIQLAYDRYLQKVGPAVIIVHSQGGGFAAQAAYNHPELVKAIVFLEPAGMPNFTQEQIKKIGHIPQLFIWGDFLDEYPMWNKTVANTDSYYKAARRYYDRLAAISPEAKWLELPDIGIKGNTHMLIHDKNTVEIAQLAQDWLASQGIMG